MVAPSKDTTRISPSRTYKIAPYSSQESKRSRTKRADRAKAISPQSDESGGVSRTRGRPKRFVSAERSESSPSHERTDSEVSIQRSANKYAKRGVRKSKVIPEESEHSDVSMRSIKTERQPTRARGRRGATPA